MLIDLEELAGNIASKVDGARLTPVIEKEIVHYEIIRSLGRNGLLQDITFQGGTSLRLCYGSQRIPWIVREQEIDFPAVAALVAAKHGDYLCPVPLSSMIAVGMQRAHVCYADGSFTGQMQRFLSPAILNRTHDFDSHCDALNAIVEKCFDRVAFSLGISDQVERARRKLATEISSGSISSAVLPKRTLGLS